MAEPIPAANALALKKFRLARNFFYLSSKRHTLSILPTGIPDFRARAMQPALSGPEADMSTKAVPRH